MFPKSNMFKLMGLVKKPEFYRWCSSKVQIINKDVHSKDYNLGQPSFETHPHIVASGEVGPGISKEEFQFRRAKLMAAVYQYGCRLEPRPSEHIIIIPSATKQYMSDKIPYVFRQNTDFYYLSGCLEPDSCLVLYVKDELQKSTIFMRKRDSHSEMWDGPRTGVERATEFFGCDDALPVGELERFLYLYFKTTNSLIWYDGSQNVQPEVDKTIRGLGIMKRKWETPTPFIHNLRLIKSPAEIKLMQKSCDIASKGFVETMKFSHPGCTEHNLFAKIDFETRTQGAEYLAYPPVVAGGERANIIHYINNNQIVKDKEMILMDAGCEYHGYCSDITRTWPVNGKFTDEQRVLYEILLEIQKYLIGMLGDFPTIDHLFDSMCVLLGKGLSSVNVLSKSLSTTDKAKMAYKFCPHHVSHYLGMDVHDTPSISRNIKIVPGMVITVEPGIYVQSNFNVPHEFKNIGIRIEDDILITENGPVVLSRKSPKEINEIEKICQNL